MARSAISPSLKLTFDHVYSCIAAQERTRTPLLWSTGGVQFVAEAKLARDGRRFISLPHNNRIYEQDWGFSSNSMGKHGQWIGQYSVALDDWASKLG